MADRIEEGNSYFEVIDTGSNGYLIGVPEGKEQIRIQSTGASFLSDYVGLVSIGKQRTSWGTELEVYASHSNGPEHGLLRVYSWNDYTGACGNIAFGGKYNNSDFTLFARIQGKKETGTINDKKGKLIFEVKASDGELRQGLIINSDQKVSLKHGTFVYRISDSLDGFSFNDDDTLATVKTIKTYVDTGINTHTHTESDITDLVHNATKIDGYNVNITSAPSYGDILWYDDMAGEWVHGNNYRIAVSNTYVRCVDTGTGRVEVYTDNVERAQFDDSGLTLQIGASVNEFSTDGTLADDSDDAIPTEKAVKTYIDNAVAGITDDHSQLTNLDYASSGHTGFAPTSHTHVEIDITDLGNYAIIGHAHTESDITDLDKYTQAEVDSQIDSDISAHNTSTSAHSNLVKIVQCYNNTTTDLNQTTPVAVPWNGEDFKDDIFTHSNTTNNTRIYFDNAGVYNIDYSINIDHDSGRKTIGSHIRVNGTTILDRGKGYSYNRNTTNDKLTCSASLKWQFSANDYIEIVCDRQGGSGTANTIPLQSWISIELVRY